MGNMIGGAHLRRVEVGCIEYPYDALDDLLYDWYCREQGYAPVHGYGRADSSCSSSASFDQWRSSDEVLEARVRAYVMPTISFAMGEISGDDQLAILIEMRNRMGPDTWRNPREADQSRAYARAKVAIARVLSRNGVEW